MSKKISITLLLPLAVLVASPAWAGHITMENRTGQSLRMECGDHDHGVRTGNVSPGHTAGVPHKHGRIKCRAVNKHGDTVDSKHFNFDHEDERVVWRVRGREHHNEGHGGGGHH